MQNNLTDSLNRSQFRRKLQPANSRISTDPDNANNQLNQIIDKTTIKRACCLKKQIPEDPNNYVIDVRLPLFNDAKYDPNEPIGKVYSKYKIYDESIKIPKSVCNLVNTSQTECDNFYEVYCRNLVEEYKKKNNGKIDYQEFKYYKPECACYADMPVWLKNSVANPPPPKVFLPGCIASFGGAYMDPLSRDPTQINYTFCTANIDLSDFDAGRDIAVKNQLAQQCNSQGYNIPSYEEEETTDNNNDNETETEPTDNGTVIPSIPAVKLDDDLYWIFGGSSSLLLFICICLSIIILIYVFISYQK